MHEAPDQAVNLDLFWWKGRLWPVIQGGAEEGEGSDSGDSGGDTGDESSGDTGGDTSGGEGEGEEDKKFSQADIDRIAARAADKAKRGKLDPKEFGFESAKDLKTFLDNAKVETDKAKTDAEKAVEQAKTEAADNARKEVLSTANERVMRAEFMLAAQEHDVAHAKDAYVIAQTLELWQDVTIDESGVVSGLDKEFFEEFKKQKPMFMPEEGGEGGSGDIGAGAGADKSRKVGQYTEDELKKKFPALKR